MHHPPGPNDVGLRLVILYKTVKGVTWLTLVVMLGLGIHFGLAERLQNWIDVIHTNATHAWSIRLTEWLFTFSTKQHLELVVVALTLDGSLTLFEGWALHHRKPWGEWLVVVTTGTLLPFEIYAIIKAVHLVRVVIFVLNVWIVIYLAVRISRERAERAKPLEPV